MKRFGYCLWAALIMGIAACKAQQAGNEPQQSANEARQLANDEKPAAKVAAGKCPDFSTKLPNTTPDLTRKVYACVERNALLYAKGPDSPEALSKAVVVRCKDRITQYVDEEAKKAGVKPPYREAFESWQAHTLPIIAEARARGCYT
jgi:hypothetical protein